MAKAKRRDLRLRLYIAGNAPNSLQAVQNARAILELHFASTYTLEIVDMLLHPQRALDDGVIVTPTLIRLTPLPAQCLIGNLSDAAQLLLALGST